MGLNLWNGKKKKKILIGRSRASLGPIRIELVSFTQKRSRSQNIENKSSALAHNTNKPQILWKKKKSTFVINVFNAKIVYSAWSKCKQTCMLLTLITQQEEQVKISKFLHNLPKLTNKAWFNGTHKFLLLQIEPNSQTRMRLGEKKKKKKNQYRIVKKKSETFCSCGRRLSWKQCWWKQRSIPLMVVRTNIIFCLSFTFVFKTRYLGTCTTIELIVPGNHHSIPTILEPLIFIVTIAYKGYWQVDGVGSEKIWKLWWWCRGGSRSGRWRRGRRNFICLSLTSIAYSPRPSSYTHI